MVSEPGLQINLLHTFCSPHQDTVGCIGRHPFGKVYEGNLCNNGAADSAVQLVKYIIEQDI